MPAMTLPAAIPSTTASGWMDTARPITKGCNTWASSCCTAMISPRTSRAYTMPLASRATTTAKSGNHRADKRNESTEEHQRCQRQSQRHSHDRQPGADPDRVDQGDQKGGAHISDQRVKAGPSRVADPFAHGARQHLSDELPDVAAAVQEKDQREQRQQRAGEDLGEGARGRQGTAGQLILMAAQRADRRVAGLIDLVSAQPQGPLISQMRVRSMLSVT